MVDFELEGFDSASTLLKHYNREQSSWDIRKEGEFWDAVAFAHSLGKRGAGRRIAVIDAGFDLTIPALRKQKPMNSVGAEPSAHGSVVALLMHEVAPESELLLYTTTSNGKVNSALIVDAIRDATEHCVDVINLSLGKHHPLIEVLTLDVVVDLANGVAQAAKKGDPRTGLSELIGSGWRRFIKSIPNSPVNDAVEFAASRGITVVAASGNDTNSISAPALLPHVFSIGFQTVGRTSGKGMQKAVCLPPAGYSQSQFADFMVVQPLAVLGSSFATPLVGAFAVLMKDRKQLDAYRAMAYATGEASALMSKLTFDDGWSPMAQTIDDLFIRAIKQDPHRHLDEVDQEPCPECSYFAAPSYVNFGIWKFNWGDLTGAELLLRTARRFAPANVDAAANLAMTIARRVDHDRGSMSIDEMARSLREAAGHMQFATNARPHHKPYHSRYLEFQAAAERPTEWHLSR